MQRPTALVAEDEAVLREELCAHLAALWPELHIVAHAANGLEDCSATTTGMPPKHRRFEFSDTTGFHPRLKTPCHLAVIAPPKN